MDKDCLSSLCETCSRLDIKGWARPAVSCQKPLPCNEAAEDEDPRVFDGSNPKYKELGSVEEIRTRRDICSLCSLIAESLDDKASGGAAKCHVLERQAICSFELPEEVNASDAASTHFHYTHTAVVFDPSTECHLQGPVMPWELKNFDSERARNIIELQIKAENSSNGLPQPRQKDGKSTTGEQSLLCSVGGRCVTEKVDICLLQEWLRLCESCHGAQCNNPLRLPAGKETGPALVIDVQESCIVETPTHCRYVALSYVWGTAMVFKHVRDNSAHIRKPGSLREAPLPATIRDAMLLVRAMGERYLWVDSICIIQDDFKTQQSQIMRMGSIYSKAAFTIIAAFGDGADSGLPGVRSKNWKRAQKVLRIGNNELLTVLDNKDASEGIDSSVWANRAWTFQERLLSKRVLVFTETQVYWNCRSTVYSEEFAAEGIRNVRRYHLSIGKTYHEEMPDQPLAAKEFCVLYDDLIASYRQRRLSFQSDILNAFAGISEILAVQHKDEFLWGLPKGYFSFALTWRFVGHHTRNRANVRIASDKDQPQTVAVPSWTWAAWSGDNDLPWLGIGWLSSRAPNGIEITAVIDFHLVDAKGRLIKIEQRLPTSHGNTESDSRISRWRGKDCLESALKPAAEGPSLKIGHLYFCTSVAKLRVIRKQLEGAAGTYCQIIPPEDTEITQDLWDFSTPIVTLGSTEHIKGESLDQHFKGSKFWTLIEKSEEFHHNADMIFLDFIVVAKRESYGGALMLLAVEWKDGVAYRLGIAQMFEPVWIKLKSRDWRPVILG